MWTTATELPIVVLESYQVGLPTVVANTTQVEAKMTQAEEVVAGYNCAHKQISVVVQHQGQSSRGCELQQLL